MNFEKYLHRIDYTDELEPTLAVLQKLQRTHVLNIPFENLDIHYGIPIILDLEKIFEKVVVNGRGGFCYELNGLFYKLLKYIGFDVRRVSARVHGGYDYGAEYDHLATIATINGVEYLTDVGFGDFTFKPLKLELNAIQKDERGDYMIEAHEEDYLRVRKVNTKEFSPEYIFKSIARDYAEFSEMCHYHQTSPKSHFTQQKMITKAIEKGRVTLTAKKLKISLGEDIKEIIVHTDEEFDHLLWSYFHIKMK